MRQGHKLGTLADTGCPRGCRTCRNTSSIVSKYGAAGHRHDELNKATRIALHAERPSEQGWVKMAEFPAAAADRKQYVMDTRRSRAAGGGVITGGQSALNAGSGSQAVRDGYATAEQGGVHNRRSKRCILASRRRLCSGLQSFIACRATCTYAARQLPRSFICMSNGRAVGMQMSVQKLQGKHRTWLRMDAHADAIRRWVWCSAMWGGDETMIRYVCMLIAQYARQNGRAVSMQTSAQKMLKQGKHGT